MNKKIKRLLSHFPRKKSGAVLFVTMILSGLIITVGLGLAKILATEVNFSADVLFSEKAYFAAESGVEMALGELNISPVQNVERHETNVRSGDESAQSILTIENLLPRSGESSFSFQILPLQTQKLRLKKDTDPAAGIANENVESFDLRVEGGRLHWKFLCQTKDGTVALQNVSDEGDISNFYHSQRGNYDDESGLTFINKSFEELEIPSQDCFLSFTNLDQSNPIEITFSGSQLPPPRALVKAIGQSGGRQKSIVFEYAQKNLSSFFDFGLFHTESGF